MWVVSPALRNILHPTCLYNSLSTSSSWSLITLSLYPPLGRKNTPSLSSLSHWNQPGRRPLQSSMISLDSEHQRSTSLRWDQASVNPVSSQDFMLVKLNHKPALLCDNIGAQYVKLCYHPPLLIFTEGEINSRESSCKLFLLFVIANMTSGKIEKNQEKDAVRLWFNSKTAPPSCLYSQHALHSNEKKCLMGIQHCMASTSFPQRELSRQLQPCFG